MAGKLQQFQNFVEWQNKPVWSKIVRQSVQVLPDVCNSYISEGLAQVRMIAPCLCHHPAVFFRHLCFIVLSLSQGKIWREFSNMQL
jgi:hypothetical protein